MTMTNPSLHEELASFSWNHFTPERAKEISRQAQAQAGLPYSDADGGFYLTSRYDDVVAVMSDPATFSSWPTVFRPMAPDVPPFPSLEYDPPQHGRWREIFRELVNPRTVKRLREQVLADVDRHIDMVIESGEVDLMLDIAEYIPAETICRAAGIDDMDLAHEIRLGALEALNASGKDPEAFPLRIAEFGALVMPIVADRLQNPRDDFFTRLTTAQPDGKPLTPQDFVGTIFGLLAAGHHSTTSAMSTLFLDVFSRPEVHARLLAEPQIITTVIEESLRIDPPFYGFYRRAAVPATIAGTSIGKDDSVCLNWVGANYDPQQFESPEEFRLDRPHYKHVSFGHGIHTCVGAPLARLELQIALEQVLKRMPDLELVGPKPEKFFGGASATYIDTLPARFTPGSRLTDEGHRSATDGE